jgi:hypothetical protein
MRTTIWTSIGVALLTIVMIGAYIFVTRGLPSALVLVNQTNEAVVGGSLIVADQTYQIGTIPVGDKMLVEVTVRRASHWDINLKINSGRMLTTNIGYLTPGVEIKDTVTISNEGIHLTDTEMNS